MFLITPIKNLSSLVDDGQTEGTARDGGRACVCVSLNKGADLSINVCVCVLVSLSLSLPLCTDTGDSLKDCAAVAFADSEYLSKA